MRRAQAIITWSALVWLGACVAVSHAVVNGAEFGDVANTAVFAEEESFDEPQATAEPPYEPRSQREPFARRQRVYPNLPCGLSTDVDEAAYENADASETTADELAPPAPFQAGACCPRQSNCFQQCCRPCQPCWTVRVGTMFLDRSRPSGSTILTTRRIAGGPELLNANQLQANAGWGYDISAIRRNVFGLDRSIEVRYFGIYGFNSTFGSAVAPAGTSIQYIVPLGNIVFPEIVSASFSSQLQSFELNTWRPTTRFMYPFAGFRYLDLTERLTTTHNIGPGLNNAVNTVSAFNTLFGGQLGVDGLLYQRRRLTLSGVAKGGVYGVSASNSAVLTQALGPTFQSAANQGNAAFVAEMGWTAQYQLNRRWSLRGTYELLWLDGVALATDQVAASNPAFGAATVTTNTVFYHGMFLGAEYRR
ncbi:MAG TPA: BBP7 family outer membrane beta-barrel protein [Pirellulales bacterium]|nr:BBP7 family outer membrane beta-barrel protein [Pirellulales bacterium]